jgi:hypothetical protein
MELGIAVLFEGGTKGSNPCSSSSESANPRSRSVVVLSPKCHLHRLRATRSSAGLIPMSRATLLQINPPERHGHAMAVFGIGTILGPIMGPALGGWLTYDYSWRWVFYINLPVGVLCTLGILVFIRKPRNVHREPFDFVGFLTLSLGIGALQLMLDRGELKDWFHSSEIWIEPTVAGLGFYLFRCTRSPPTSAAGRPLPASGPPHRAPPGRPRRSPGDAGNRKSCCGSS